MPPREVIHWLVDTVSKNGTFLLNIPGKPDGTIDRKERLILERLGEWFKINGEAIYFTRPWTVFGEAPRPAAAPVDGKPTAPFSAHDIRYTRNKAGTVVYAIALGWPEQALLLHALGTTASPPPGKVAHVELLGSPERLRWHQAAEGLSIAPPRQKPDADYAVAFKISLVIFLRETGGDGYARSARTPEINFIDLRRGSRDLRLGLIVEPRGFGGRPCLRRAGGKHEPGQDSRRICQRRLFLKGVHYGASTEGPMRFMPPSPPRPWTGVRDALTIGPPAPQDSYISENVLKFIGEAMGPGTMGEDCLVLNIWTPSLGGSSKRPVMVWLHGGGYTTGSAGVQRYDGANLAAKHDVVVVGINHRLNVFGYLYLARMGGEKFQDSGNVGMLDIVLALKWINHNCPQFGGDPHNVTIFGQSGGGGKVSTLMAMPSAKGLFHKAIVESGSTLTVRSPEEADATARKFLAQINVAPERVNDLQKIPMDKLIAALHSMKGPSAMGLGPVVDGRSLLRNPFDPDAPPETADVPMIIGTTETETTYMLGLGDSALFTLNEEGLRTRLKTFLKLDDDSKITGLIQAYRRNRPHATPSDIYFLVTTDRGMRLRAITQAERKAAQLAAPAYMYLFTWQTPVMGGKLKSPHGIEMAFVFDNIDKVAVRIGTGADLQPLADKVSAAWVAFARTGNPNHAGLPNWPVYDTGRRATMIFNDECRVVDDPGKDERQALLSLPKA